MSEKDRDAAAQLAAEEFYGSASNWSHFDEGFREHWRKVVDTVAIVLARSGDHHDA